MLVNTSPLAAAMKTAAPAANNLYVGFMGVSYRRVTISNFIVTVCRLIAINYLAGLRLQHP